MVKELAIFFNGKFVSKKIFYFIFLLKKHSPRYESSPKKGKKEKRKPYYRLVRCDDEEEGEGGATGGNGCSTVLGPPLQPCPVAPAAALFYSLSHLHIYSSSLLNLERAHPLSDISHLPLFQQQASVCKVFCFYRSAISTACTVVVLIV